MGHENNDRILQPAWGYLVTNHSEFMASPMFPVVVFVGFYFVCIIPYTVFDVMAMKSKFWSQKLSQYKIQENVPVTFESFKKAVVLNLFNNIVYILPVGILQWVYRPSIELQILAPTVFDIVLGVIGNTVIFDLQYYWWHRLHHTNRWLYKYVHKIHHEYTSPHAWVTQYLSPIELFTTGALCNTNSIILNQHFITGVLSTFLNIYISVEVHTGYEFPWHFSYWFPRSFYGGAPKHDMHHKKPNTNFEPFMSHWDKLFGTYCDLNHAPVVRKVEKEDKNE